MFAFGTPRPARRPSLTPMIDVVFLLLVFFMIAARFGQDGGLVLGTAAPDTGYSGPPRLIEIAPAGLRLNGTEIDVQMLPDALAPLMEHPQDTIVLRPIANASLQRLVDVMTALRDRGLTQMVIVE